MKHLLEFPGRSVEQTLYLDLGCPLDVPDVLSFHLVPFPLSLIICFSKSYNTGIVGDRVSKFSSDIFICSLFLKDISGDIEKYYNLL